MREMLTPKSKTKSGYLKYYTDSVGPADKGAVRMGWADF